MAIVTDAQLWFHSSQSCGEIDGNGVDRPTHQTYVKLSSKRTDDAIGVVLQCSTVESALWWKDTVCVKVKQHLMSVLGFCLEAVGKRDMAGGGIVIVLVVVKGVP